MTPDSGGKTRIEGDCNADVVIDVHPELLPDSSTARETSGDAVMAEAGAPTAPPQVPSGSKLALNDDFTSPTLGLPWNIGTDQGSFLFEGTTYYDCWVPAEAEYPTASMVKTGASGLVLSVMVSSPIVGDQGSKSFISGYVNSYGNFAFQYGYLEIRARLPAATPGTQTGLWPALWLFNSTYANVDEIDLVESFGGDQTSIGMTVHDAAINAINSTGDQVTVTITTGYHVFGVLHEASSISFYVDNHLEKTFNVALASEMAINMGVQLGNATLGWISGPVPANWGSGIHGAHAPDMDVDWVHVWTE
jgi:hypothetical protein